MQELKETIIDDIEEKARRLFGAMVCRADPEVVALGLPGVPSPVLIQVASVGDDVPSVVSFRTQVARELDWTTAGLADFLLRENLRMLMARFAREDEALVLECELPGELGEAQIARVVSALAHWTTSSYMSLTRLGVLSIGEE